MKTRKRSGCLPTLAAAVMAALPAMAQDLPSRVPESIRRTGRLVVGTSPTYPPLEFKDPGTSEIVGLDVDLSNEIGRRLGLTVEWREQSFDQLINSLDTGRIDMGASGMTDIPSRREKTDFVDYFSTGTQLFTLRATAGSPKTVEDVCGRTVAVNRNGIFLIRLREFDRDVCEAKGLPEVVPVPVDRTADARLALLQGRAVAAAQGVDAIRYLDEREDSPDRGKFALVGAPIAVDLAGLGFAKGDAALRDAVAAALGSMIADGSYGRIFAKWDLPYAEVGAVTVNAAPPGPR